MDTNTVKADLVYRERRWIDEGLMIEIVVWRLPRALPGSAHPFKYRMALVSAGVCVLRYDNEAGKGDHKHIEEIEQPYGFIDLDALQRDFWHDVDVWRAKR